MQKCIVWRMKQRGKVKKDLFARRDIPTLITVSFVNLLLGEERLFQAEISCLAAKEGQRIPLHKKGGTH